MLLNYLQMSGSMLKIGQLNTLIVSDEFPFGFYLAEQTPGEAEKVLLPADEARENCKVGDELEVFVYHDSDDRLVATTRTPKAMLNDIAFLRVKHISKVGAFLDWGLNKDLLVPFNEQDKPLSEGLDYVVYVFQDEQTDRLAASTRLYDFLSEDGSEFTPKQPVELVICGRSEMGYKAVINGTHLGLVFKDEVFSPLRIGDKKQGFIKRIRDDKKIDLCFQFHDDDARKNLATQIIDDLVAHGGMSTLTDKSSAQEINQRFGVSKGAYKKAIGALYRQKRILLDKTKITLLDNNNE